MDHNAIFTVSCDTKTNLTKCDPIMVSYTNLTKCDPIMVSYTNSTKCDPIMVSYTNLTKCDPIMVSYIYSGLILPVYHTIICFLSIYSNI